MASYSSNIQNVHCFYHRGSLFPVAPTFIQCSHAHAWDLTLRAIVMTFLATKLSPETFSVGTASELKLRSLFLQKKKKKKKEKDKVEFCLLVLCLRFCINERFSYTLETVRSETFTLYRVHVLEQRLPDILKTYFFCFCCIEVNGYTFRGSNSAIYILPPPPPSQVGVNF